MCSAGVRTASCRLSQCYTGQEFEQAGRGTASWDEEEMRTEASGVIRLLALIAIASFPVSAYQESLSSESIRQAYFLGQRKDDATTSFLARYYHYFSLPKTGPYISCVQVLTPYAQIVLGAESGEIRGSAMEAERHYRTHPRLFLVRVRVYSTPTFPSAPKGEQFWEKLSILVAQGESLKPGKTNYLSLPRGRGPAYTDVELSFDAVLIKSAPITVEVSTPDGQRIEANFDLDKLK